MIFERSAKIGLRVVDPRKMIEYPSAAHTLVAHEIERTTREEEMRILYVAMTRARDKLILVGSRDEMDDWRETVTGAAPRRPPTRLSVAMGTTPLGWLLPSLAGAPRESVEVIRGADHDLGGGMASRSDQAPVVRVHVHGADEMAGWSTEASADESQEAMRAAVARCDPLPNDEPMTCDDSEVGGTLRRLDFVYPRLASSSVRATMAASEFKGAYDFTRDPDERPQTTRPYLSGSVFEIPPSKYAAESPDGPAQRGIATHRALEHLDFNLAVDAEGVASELQRMVQGGLLSAEDRSAVMDDAIAWFVSTPLAEAIRRVGSNYRREFRFVTTEPVTFFDHSVNAGQEDRVLVRGMVDGILVGEEALEIVDFKTDAIREEELSERCEGYRSQMTLYCRAVSRLWGKPVRTCWLVFLAPRTVVPIRDAAANSTNQ
jgi:ATP-dependent helicase/nuclease subunit A